MRWIAATFGLFWKVYFLLLTILSIIVLYPFFYFWAQQDKHLPKFFKLMRFQAWFLLTFGGIFPKIDRRFKLEKGKAYVICPNHTSYLDILCLYYLFPGYFVLMGKQELGKIPLFNIYFKKLNILVDRKSRIGAHKAFLKAAAEIDKGNSIAMFPEGTIPKNTPKLKHFKNGAFKIAIEKQIEIVPVTFLNNYQLLEENLGFTSFSRPGISKIVIHEPVQTKGKSDHELVEVRNEVFNIIEETLKKDGDYHKFVKDETSHDNSFHTGE